jgi:segregation and condensation protein B
MSDQSKSKSAELSLEAQIEALLFVAPGTVSIKHMAEALELKPRAIEKGIKNLQIELERRGLRLQKHRNEYKMVSAPQLSEQIERFLNLEATSRLSAAALECLAIIAYQQSVTRPQIDSIRGVNSDGVIRTLLSNGLIEEAGRTEGPGRPILYVTSPDFLQHFGLAEINELPPLKIEERLDELDKQENADNGEQELLKS